jgi:hypothetical protein
MVEHLHFAPRARDLALKGVKSCKSVTLVSVAQTGDRCRRESRTEVVDDDVDVGLVGVDRADLRYSKRGGSSSSTARTMLPRQVKYKALAAVTMVRAGPALRRAVKLRAKGSALHAPAAVAVDGQAALSKQRLRCA